MSKNIGGFLWADLTIDSAEQIRDFYCKVIGYTYSPVSMGDYEDYCMISPSDADVKSGICHRQGVNANLPPIWLIYFNVDNIETSIHLTESLGGKLISPIKAYGLNAKYAVIQYPAGAICALYQTND